MALNERETTSTLQEKLACKQQFKLEGIVVAVELIKVEVPNAPKDITVKLVATISSTNDNALYPTCLTRSGLNEGSETYVAMLQLKEILKDAHTTGKKVIVTVERSDDTPPMMYKVLSQYSIINQCI